MGIWNYLFGREKTESSKKPSSWTNCVMGEGASVTIPKTYYITKKFPLIVNEETHYHIMSWEGGGSSMGHPHSSGGFLSGLETLPEGVYTLEEFLTLDEFVVSNEDKSERDSGTVS